MGRRAGAGSGAWKFVAWWTVGGWLVAAASASAVPITVGSGSNRAGLYLEFKDAAIYEFAVRFDGTTTGLGLFDRIEAETTLTTIRQDFGFGVFVDGIAFEGHGNSGWGGGEDWWHYWIKNAGDAAWISSGGGAADRVVADGDWDGWVYGRGTPVPEPAGLALLSMGALVWWRRRSCKSTRGCRKPELASP